MADGEHDSSETPPGSAGRRRMTPTIDLTATEIPAASEPNVAASSAGSSPTPNAREPAPAPQAESVMANPQPAPDTMQGDMPPPPPPEPPPPSGSGASDRRPFRLWSTQVKSGLVGAGAMLALLAVLWAAGLFSARDNGSAPLAARLAALELQVRDLGARPAPDPTIVSRLGAAESAAKSASDSIATLSKRVDDAAAAGMQAGQNASPAARDIEALSARVAALERGARALEGELGKRMAASPDRAVRLAVAATVLKSAVERGEPFADQLAAARALVGDDKALAPLEPFARTGVPTSLALGRQLSGIVHTIRKNVGTTPREGGFIDRLQANAERLIRIRPVDEVPGDDPATVVNRLELRAARSDIPGALAELEKLPPPIRAPADDWIKQAEAQRAAVEAARRLAGDALIALGKGS